MGREWVRGISAGDRGRGIRGGARSGAEGEVGSHT
jgi:hypothetical protein